MRENAHVSNGFEDIAAAFIRKLTEIEVVGDLDHARSVVPRFLVLDVGAPGCIEKFLRRVNDRYGGAAATMRRAEVIGFDRGESLEFKGRRLFGVCTLPGDSDEE